jgi:Uncharacterized component of anaerobic dehydrogenases
MIVENEEVTRLPPEQLMGYAQAFNLLGSCYRIAPDDRKLAPMLSVFDTGDWVHFWVAEIPEKHHDYLRTGLSQKDQSELKKAWSRLFVGPEPNPVPPWGSVYLDPERLLQGESTQALKVFLKREQLNVKTDCPEPPDHIGLMLYQAAFLAAKEREDALLELLREHLYTWLPFYLKQHGETKVSSFYTALTKLTLITVESLL